MADEPVFAQVLGRAWHPRFRQVAGRGAGDDARGADAPRDEVRHSHLADPHRDVDAFGLQVHVAVVEAHFQRDVRVTLREARNGRQQQVFAEGHRDVDAQLALGTIARQAQQIVRRVDLREDALAVLQVHRTLRRHRYLARGAVEQAGAEMFFQLRDVARSHGTRHVERAGGPCKRAVFGNPAEYPHGLQLIHKQKIVKKMFTVNSFLYVFLDEPVG